MSMGKLEGKAAVITRCHQDKLDDAVKDIGNNVCGVQGDVANLADLDRLYQTVQSMERIDIVFANVGFSEFAPLEDVTEEHFDPAFAVYGASKAAIRNFVRGWTVELKGRRVRSNVLSPSTIATPLTDAERPDAIEKIVSAIPMGRMGQPGEAARAALFLASDDSSFVTGIAIRRRWQSTNLIPKRASQLR
jgi:NAD(P)-dependent dehydrogenase (short-subunit alcohol dehydrogenase family)